MFAVGCLLACCLLPHTACSQTLETAPAAQTPTAEAPAAQTPAIADWIRQLDADSFKARTGASRSLYEAGPAALAALAKAALGDSAEVTERSVGILKQHFANDAQSLKKAAEEVLKQLAASEHERAAQLASSVLNPHAPPVERVAQAFGAPAQVQVQLQILGRAQAVQGMKIGGIGGMKKKIMINGQSREIDVEENGRKIKISTSNDGKIEIQVTEKKDGKEVTQKATAKSEAELKAKHPELHKHYETHTKGVQAVIQIQAVPAAVPLPR